MPWGLSSTSSSGGISSIINTISATSGSIQLDAQATNVMASVTGDCTFTFTNWPSSTLEARFSLRINTSTGANTLSFAGVSSTISISDGEALTIDFRSVDGGTTIQVSALSSLSQNSLLNHGTVTTAVINPAYASHIITVGDSLTLTAEGWPVVDADGSAWCEVKLISAQGKTVSFPSGSIYPGGVAATIVGTCNFKFEKLGARSLTISMIDEDVR